MAYINETTNPCEPSKGRKHTVLKRRMMIGTWLRKRYGANFKEFPRATLLTINSKPILRKGTKWKSIVMERDDIVNVIALPGITLTAVQWLWVAVAALSVSVVALAATNNLPKLQSGQVPNADPTFTLAGRSNQQKIGNPIEVQYGQVLRWPSYAARPYNQYKNNQQWLYQLFCLGQGEFDIDEVKIGSTLIGDYQDVSYQIVPPGSVPTLFPTNVVTSSDVSDIELLGPNQSAYPGYSGPYTIVPTGKTTTKIECDVVFPAGLYKANSSGGIDTVNVTAQFQYQLIDNAGTPIGAWTDMTGLNVTYSSVNSQSITLESTVAAGRYRIQARRTSNRSTDIQTSDKLVWSAARCFLPDTNDYGDVTLLAIAAKATNNLNSNSASQVNVLCTRKLPIYDSGTGTWSAPTGTRLAIWAVCDVLRSAYGGNLADTFLDLPALVAINNTLITRGDFFDWTFDSQTTVWDALRLIGMTCRMAPSLNGSQVTMVRDALQTIPVGAFSPYNIVKGSFQWQVKLPGYDYNTGLEVTYQDPATYIQTTVNCVLPDESGDNMARIAINGIISRQQAYNEGMYMRKSQRLLRQNITFQTGMEGFIPSYGDLIRVAYDVPKWSTSGQIYDWGAQENEDPPYNTVYFLYLTNAIDVTTVSPRLAIRYKDGTLKGPFIVSFDVSNPKFLYLDTQFNPTFDPSILDYTTRESLNQGGTIFFFGGSTDLGVDCRVIRINPNSNDTVEIQCYNYIGAELYDSDGDTPPVGNNIYGSLPAVDDVPAVTNLQITASPQLSSQAVASWDKVDQAQYYVLELSYDGDSWTTINGKIEGTTWTFEVLPKYIYVRVSAVNTGAGDYSYWFGNAPSLVPPAPTGDGAGGTAPVAVRGLGGSILIKWHQSNSANLFYYKVYRSLTNDASTSVVIGTALANQYVDAPLDLDTAYYYWITQVNTSNVESAKSIGCGDTTNAGPVNPGTPADPTAATAVTGAFVDGTGTVLAYIDVTVPALAADTAMLQVLYKRNDASSSGWQVAAEPVAGSVVIRISDLATNTAYNVATRTFDAYFNPSNVVPISSGGGTLTTPLSPDTPSQPTGLIATKGTGQAITLDWDDNTQKDFNEYAVYRGTTNVFGSATLIAETRASVFVDVKVTFGTSYYYWVKAINSSEQYSTQSSGVGPITPSQVSGTEVDPTAPTNPAQMNWYNGGSAREGTYTARDGTTLCWMVMEVGALTYLGAYQNILYRKNGATNWQIAAQMANTGTEYVYIDDLVPGQAYQFALQVFTKFGIASAITQAAYGGGSYFTPAVKNTAPSVPVTFTMSKKGVTPKQSGTSTPVIYFFGIRISWAAMDLAAYPDFSHFEVKCPSTNDSTATGNVWSSQNGVAGDDIAYDSSIVLYNAANNPGYVFVRSVNKSGVASAWSVSSGVLSPLGNLQSNGTYATGSMAGQNSDAVATTGITTGGGASQRKVLARQPIYASINLSGGVAQETYNLSLGNFGFSAAPDSGWFQSADYDGMLIRYDFDNSSSSTAVLRVTMADGSNVPNVTGMEMTGELVEYT